MNIPVDHANEAYWDLIAENYDHNFPETVIGRVQRDAVWHELDRAFQPGMRILELNCGTGIDAVHLAKLGVRVVACDLSSKMIDAARRRLSAAFLDGLVDFRVLDTEKIETLIVDAPFDGAFSNFSGLNCVQDVSRVAENLSRLLKPSAQILLCMVGRFSPWETAWHLAHGKPVVALHSFKRKPTAGLSSRGTVSVHYPSVRDVRRMFAPKFRSRLEGNRSCRAAFLPRSNRENVSWRCRWTCKDRPVPQSRSDFSKPGRLCPIAVRAPE